jgi:hypothetical protein
VTRLLLVDIREGSATLALELPAPRDDDVLDESRLFPVPPRELGFRAMERWVGGLHELESGAIDHVPPGWDNSVMDIAERLAEFAVDRNFSITLDAQPPESRRAVARITPEAAPRYKMRHSRIRRRRTVRGRLILVDLGRGRVEVDEGGRRVECEFPEELQAVVKRLLGETVVVAGDEEFDLSTSRAQKLQLDHVAKAPEEVPLHEAFWEMKTIEELAREQGVEPIQSIQALAAPDLFADEDLEQFINIIREARGR